MGFPCYLIRSKPLCVIHSYAELLRGLRLFRIQGPPSPWVSPGNANPVSLCAVLPTGLPMADTPEELIIECIKERDWDRLRADPRQTFPNPGGPELLEFPAHLWGTYHVYRRMPHWNILALIIMYHNGDDLVEVLRTFLDRDAEVLPGCCEVSVAYMKCGYFSCLYLLAPRWPSRETLRHSSSFCRGPTVSPPFPRPPGLSSCIKP